MRTELSASLQRLTEVLEGTIYTLSMVVEARDPYTSGHQRRVAALACAIAECMNLPKEQITGIRLAGVIHDLGKIALPAEILAKPSHLSGIELDLIRTHPKAGYDILAKVPFPWPIAEIVYQHHEKVDGSGYPRALKGEEILLEARIMAVADTVEAMSSHRPYRPALGLEAAMDELLRNSGKAFDPTVVDACLQVFKVRGFHFESA
jgi:HD-GYP domain-containing protein (c-di-GMP phosphodiesterase class II)